MVKVPNHYKQGGKGKQGQGDGGAVENAAGFLNATI